MWPVFIFGTGRCGSTHLQRLISLSTCCWVWGEHEGFLAPLLESVRRCDTSSGLEQNVFRPGWRSDAELISQMSVGSYQLSWLNRLNKQEFRSEVASLVDRMFRSSVPQGWTEWGFKEILYGLDNHAPASLMSLFPNATAIFTFRDPKQTIESMIRTWSPNLLQEPPRLEELSETYRARARRWKIIVEYFLDYRNSGGNVIFLSSDKLALPVREILHALAFEPNRSISEELHATNQGFTNWPHWAQEKFDDLFSADENECQRLFSRACAESDADFGVRSNSIV